MSLVYVNHKYDVKNWLRELCDCDISRDRKRQYQRINTHEQPATNLHDGTRPRSGCTKIRNIDIITQKSSGSFYHPEQIIRSSMEHGTTALISVAIYKNIC